MYDVCYSKMASIHYLSILVFLLISRWSDSSVSFLNDIFCVVQESSIIAASFYFNGRESIVFGSNFEMEILIDFHFMRSPESENHIFSIMSVCTCMSVISITQITAETSNLAFNI